MNITDVLHVVIGIMVFFFIPGYAVMRLFYKSKKGIEMLGLAIIISICTAILIGLVLGAIGIFQIKYIIISYIILIFLLFVIRVTKKKHRL